MDFCQSVQVEVLSGKYAGQVGKVVKTTPKQVVVDLQGKEVRLAKTAVKKADVEEPPPQPPAPPATTVKTVGQKRHLEEGEESAVDIPKKVMKLGTEEKGVLRGIAESVGIPEMASVNGPTSWKKSGLAARVLADQPNILSQVALFLPVCSISFWSRTNKKTCNTIKELLESKSHFWFRKQLTENAFQAARRSAKLACEQQEKQYKDDWLQVTETDDDDDDESNQITYEVTVRLFPETVMEAGETGFDEYTKVDHLVNICLSALNTEIPSALLTYKIDLENVICAMNHNRPDLLHCDYYKSEFAKLTQVIQALPSQHRLETIGFPDELFQGGDRDECHFDILVKAALSYKQMKSDHSEYLSALFEDPGARSSGGCQGADQSTVMTTVFSKVVELLPQCPGLEELELSAPEQDFIIWEHDVEVQKQLKSYGPISLCGDDTDFGTVEEMEALANAIETLPASCKLKRVFLRGSLSPYYHEAVQSEWKDEGVDEEKIASYLPKQLAHEKARLAVYEACVRRAIKLDRAADAQAKADADEVEEAGDDFFSWLSKNDDDGEKDKINEEKKEEVGQVLNYPFSDESIREFVAGIIPQIKPDENRTVPDDLIRCFHALLGQFLSALAIELEKASKKDGAGFCPTAAEVLPNEFAKHAQKNGLAFAPNAHHARFHQELKQKFPQFCTEFRRPPSPPNPSSTFSFFSAAPTSEGKDKQAKGNNEKTEGKDEQVKGKDESTEDKGEQMVVGDVVVLGMCDYLLAECLEVGFYGYDNDGSYEVMELTFSDVRSFHAALTSGDAAEAKGVDSSVQDWFKLRYNALPMTCLSESIRKDEELNEAFNQFGLSGLLCPKRPEKKRKMWSSRRAHDSATGYATQQRKKRMKKVLKQRAKAKWVDVLSQGLGFSGPVVTEQGRRQLPSVASLTEFFTHSPRVDKFCNEEGSEDFDDDSCDGAGLLETIREAWAAEEASEVEMINATEKFGKDGLAGPALVQVLGALVLLHSKWKQEPKFKLTFSFDDEEEDKELRKLLVELFGEDAVQQDGEPEEPDDDEAGDKCFMLVVAQARRKVAELSMQSAGV